MISLTSFSHIIRKSSVASLLIALWVLAGILTAKAQDSVLVSSAESELDLFDLGLDTHQLSIPGGSGTSATVIDLMNPRLVYTVADFYISVFDLTIGREVNRISGLWPTGGLAVTPDGKYLLVGDAVTPTLNV